MELDVVEQQSGKTWRQAFAELRKMALRHKVISAMVVAAVLGSLAGIAVAGITSSGSGGTPGGVTEGGSSWAVQPSGKPAARAFSLPLLGASGQVSLAQYAGKPLIVNFFASWCGPCEKETPMLARFYRAHHGSVALVGIDGNDVTSNALRFARASGVSYPVGWDPQINVGVAYQVSGVPQTFFLDARHRVVYRVFGAVTPAQLSEGLALSSSSSSR